MMKNLYDSNLSATTAELLDHEEEEIENAFGWLMLDVLNNFYMPVIIAVGILGNSLSTVLFLSAPLRSRSSSFYLAALACADFCFLCTLLLVLLSKHEIDLYQKQGFCQLLNFLSAVSNCTSVWVIVCSTFDRFIVVRFPLQRPRLCTVQNAKRTVLILVSLSLLTHIYVLVMSGVVYRDGQWLCDANLDYIWTLRVINVFDTFFTFLLPVVLIVTMNASIALQLYRFYRTYRGPPTSAGGGDPTTATTALDCCSSHSSVAASRAVLQQPSTDGRLLRIAPCRLASAKTKHNVTRMLLVVSVVFIALHMPSYVIRLYSHWAATVSNGVILLQQFSMMLFYTNFSVNFLLYSIYGVAFREALRTLLQERWRRMPFCGADRHGGDDVEQLNGKKTIPMRSRTV